MARALALKDGASPDERSNAKWQTIQVSTLSIANCIGRISIGSGPPAVEHFAILTLQSDRCDCRLCEAQRNEAGLVHLHSGHDVPHFSTGRPLRSRRRALAIRGCLGWDFVRRGLRTLADNRDRVVWNGCARPFLHELSNSVKS